MDPLTLGILMFGTALVLLLLGMPIWAGLSGTALFFLIFLDPSKLAQIPYIHYSNLENFSLLAIPLFILMAAPLAQTKASGDLYELLHRWLHWLPGGVGISNVLACAVFAALTGSSPATAAAIGGLGIPEMRQRGYPAGFACGLICAGGTLGILIPPSITMILYGVATETSIGKCFMAGIIPGIILTVLMCAWTSFYFYTRVMRKQKPLAEETQAKDNQSLDTRYVAQTFTWSERFGALPRLLPFMLIIFGVLGSLYLGWASPSEAAAVGAFLSLVVTAIVYKAYRPKHLKSILSSTLNESTMILMIIAGSLLFGYVLSNAYATQSMAQAIIGLPLGRWGIMIVINIFLLLLGMFLPPVAIILMVAPIIFPILMALGFDPIWFAAVMTLNMEIGLITPPVGLNLYIVKGIAPDIPMSAVLKGALPFVFMIALTIVIISIFPQLATWLPSMMIGT